MPAFSLRCPTTAYSLYQFEESYAMGKASCTLSVFMNMNAETDKEIVHHMYHLISNWADQKTRINYYAKNQSYEVLIENLDNSKT